MLPASGGSAIRCVGVRAAPRTQICGFLHPLIKPPTSVGGAESNRHNAMSEIIRARGLVKRFGELVAVDGIDFSVAEGECFGLLGPNGAGKTSTIRMITCVSPLTAGELFVDGMDVRTDGRRIKATLGVVPQDN